MFIDNLL